VEVMLVGVGGALGATVRYLVGVWLSDARYPVPTLVVNVLGSALFGLVLAVAAGDAVLLFGVGLCGALTTFSTFAVDTVRLAAASRLAATGYAVGTLGACLSAVGLASMAANALG
jgi:CrcB protein